MDGLALTIGSGAIGAICGVLGAWIKARYSKTTIEPNPICIKKTQDDKDDSICEEARKRFQNRIEDIDRRLSKLEGENPHINQALHRIETKLDTVILRSHP